MQAAAGISGTVSSCTRSVSALRSTCTANLHPRSLRINSLTLHQRSLPRAARGVLTVFVTAVSEAPSITAPPPPAITITKKALKHLTRMKEDKEEDGLLLRIGVKQGGCSGMSYVMDFEQEQNVKAEDSVMVYANSFKLVCDPKSLLFLFGMELDYSDALIGGGFQFQNPNAQSSCGCGKSFKAG